MLQRKFKQKSDTIYVDDREPDEVYEEFVFQTTTNPKFEHLKVVKMRLPVGDLVYMNLCAERKDIDDFVASIKDARVFNQMKKMYDNYKECYILVDGSPRKIYKSEAKAVFTVMADAEHRYGIHSRFCETTEMLVYYFLTLCIKVAKVLPPNWKLIQSKKMDRYDYRISMMRALPNIDKKCAIIALNTYLSFHDMCHATVKELMMMELYGKARATSLHTALNKKSKAILSKKPPNAEIKRDEENEEE